MTVVPIQQLLCEIDVAQLYGRSHKRRSLRGVLFDLRRLLRIDRGGIAW